MRSLVGSFGWQDGDVLRVSRATAKLLECSTDTAWVASCFSIHRNTRTQDLAFSHTECYQASSESGHRGTSKVWQGEGGKVAKWGFIAALSRETQMPVQVTLSCGWIVLFLLASAGLADTADYTWRGQEEEG